MSARSERWSGPTAVAGLLAIAALLTVYSFAVYLIRHRSLFSQRGR